MDLLILCPFSASQARPHTYPNDRLFLHPQGTFHLLFFISSMLLGRRDCSQLQFFPPTSLAFIFRFASSLFHLRALRFYYLSFFLFCVSFHLCSGSVHTSSVFSPLFAHTRHIIDHPSCNSALPCSSQAIKSITHETFYYLSKDVRAVNRKFFSGSL